MISSGSQGSFTRIDSMLTLPRQPPAMHEICVIYAMSWCFEQGLDPGCTRILVAYINHEYVDNCTSLEPIHQSSACLLQVQHCRAPWNKQIFSFREIFSPFKNLLSPVPANSDWKSAHAEACYPMFLPVWTRHLLSRVCSCASLLFGKT